MDPRNIAIKVGMFRALAVGLLALFILPSQTPFGGMPGAVFLLVYSGLAAMLSWYAWRKPEYTTPCHMLLWGIDVVAAAVLSILFSSPATSAPALLPALAYEAESFWPRRGRIMGGLTVIGLLGFTWWVRVWAGLPTFTPVTMVFWAVVILILIGMPFGVLGPSSFGKAPAQNDRLDENHVGESNLLSPREKEILSYLLTPDSMTEIARRLVIDVGTVKTHASRIYRKLNVHTRGELKAAMERIEGRDPKKSS